MTGVPGHPGQGPIPQRPAPSGLVDPSGAPLLTEEQKKIQREEALLQLLAGINHSLAVIAEGVTVGFPRFDAAQVASANALSIIAAAAGHLGLVDVDEMEQAAKESAAGAQGESPSGVQEHPGTGAEMTGVEMPADGVEREVELNGEN